MEPTQKAPAIENFLNSLSGDNRQQAIRENRCINPPIGCGKPISGFFRNDSCMKEYTTSGLCQQCQDEFFGVDNNE
jgi:hypothetical protein